MSWKDKLTFALKHSEAADNSDPKRWFMSMLAACGVPSKFFCDEDTGALVIEDSCGKELLRKEFAKPFVCQAEQPTKDDVAAGVCLWRNINDMCLYTVKVNDDGTCEWYSSDQKIEPTE